jgi:hypothetical protein
MHAVFQLHVAANSGLQLRLHACWNVTPSEGVKRSAARGDELSLLIDKSPRGRLPNQRLQKSRVNPQALAEDRAPCSQRQIITIF